MEILTSEGYDEYEGFIRSHPQGGITQSAGWHSVKAEWRREVVVSRNGRGEIAGGMSVLIRRMPIFGAAMLYSPRGPVCDLHDEGVLRDLKAGADALAKKHKAYIFKMDPDIDARDEIFTSIAKSMGFKIFTGGDGFETVQPRFNWRLYLEGKSEDEILAGMKQKTRYNIRVAIKKGVEIRVMGKEALGDFTRLMAVTGERDGFTVRSAAYFARMLEALGGSVKLYMAYLEGKAVAGAVTSNYAGKCCYLYGASDNENRNAMPTYLLQWEMIREAIRSGCTLYDFQGVSGNLSEDNPLYGLYKFKSGFGGSLDETPGEFDLVYMPVRAWLLGKAISLAEWLRKKRRRG
ncbi:MAG: peptidoglycan bridge formation glycyltransferase FemA/FemB family protein [Oscillospiraceae bacterium]|jgi:lipid II:glycine glycyltransferase (peptidoglycan interpeptide bridge formation enzyme)|nr:peptidoglycan bridge formation glycyltransferase FemA/FemB family protein [Oscillospiraceae bacterium]